MACADARCRVAVVGKRVVGVARDRGLPWLLSEKVTVPERVPDHFDRAWLVQQALPTQRRLTVLRAPGGFGKTTLLAECCRLLAADGVPAAWLSLDEQDDGGILDAYLAFAFERTGLDVLQSLEDDLTGGSAPGPRTELVVRAVAAHGGPCVLALDEAERASGTGALDVVDFLLQRGPPNLHVALACREMPVDLDVAGLVVAGRGTVLTAEDLRFEAEEVDAFFAGYPARERESVADAAGWPIALRMHRNGFGGGRGQGADAPPDGSADRLVDNWVDARLWRGLADGDRRLLLDVGLFEWLDAELLDEVFGVGGAMGRLADMPVLDGLLEGAVGKSTGWRLHPLLRAHCVRRVRLQEPDRLRDLQRRISAALARRGDTVLAMRHATEAGDAALAGRILEDAGGIRLHLGEGLLRLRAADRLLTDQAAERPRLALARAGLQALDGRLEAARPAFVAASGIVDRDADPPLDVRADRVYVAGIVALYGCDRLDSPQIEELAENGRRLAEVAELDPVARAGFHHGLCILHNLRAEFDEAVERAAAARRLLGDEATGLSMFVDLQVGAVAMAQGRVGEAVRRYGAVQRAARASYLRDPAAAAMAAVLARELAHERNRLTQVREVARVPQAIGRGGTPVVPYAAAAGTAVEAALRREGTAAALAVLEPMRGYAARHGLPSLARLLAALHVSLLADDGAVAAAEDVWRDAGLPADTVGCLDLTGQTWREMEALGCARLRLYIAGGEYAAGRAFGRAFAATARARGLRRTLMRALALSTRLEHRAGSASAATACMEAFLAEYAQADYAGPMVRERAAALPVLTRLVDGLEEPGEGAAAQALLGELRASGIRTAPRLTARQREVARRLAAMRDKEIARDLGISESGVRYHVGRLFHALGVRGRVAAVARAGDLGLLDSETD